MTDPHCPHCAAPIPLAVRERIAELEAEVERLREAAEAVVNSCRVNKPSHSPFADRAVVDRGRLKSLSAALTTKGGK